MNYKSYQKECPINHENDRHNWDNIITSYSPSIHGKYWNDKHKTNNGDKAENGIKNKSQKEKGMLFN